jgi:predicted unusual protein kinase regulating ubiquinone biosynthesis (AarF/ABC1/UbiB family)
VYKARLRFTGEEVAVKVQRPGIGDSIAVDMVLLRRLVAAVDKNVPQARLSTLLPTIGNQDLLYGPTAFLPELC